MDHMVYLDGQRFVPLGHPGEDADLRALGETLASAATEGRLFYCDYCVCLNCASLVTTRKLRLPAMLMENTKRHWLKSWLVVAVVVVPAIAFDWPLYVWLLLICVLAWVDEWIRTVRNRRRAVKLAAERQRVARRLGEEHEISTCSRCGSSRLVDHLRHVIDSRREGAGTSAPVRCPRCGELAFRHDDSFLMIA